MKIWASIGLGVLLLGVQPLVAGADTAAGEKKVLEEMKAAIPEGRTKTVEDLYKLSQEIASGKSSAVIIDIRTEAEFDAGHILNTNNLDAGKVYEMPKRWADENTEIWVVCRTQHRATYFTGLLNKYGYKNVYLVEKGIVGWMDAGYPLVNRYMGEIKVTKYEKELKEAFAYRDDK